MSPSLADPLPPRFACPPIHVTVPDLITVINSQNGAALGTPDYRYGLRVTVIAFACHAERTIYKSLRCSFQRMRSSYTKQGREGEKKKQYRERRQHVSTVVLFVGSWAALPWVWRLTNGKRLADSRHRAQRAANLAMGTIACRGLLASQVDYQRGQEKRNRQ